MPLFALVEGVRGSLVARPSPGAPVTGGMPRYAGLRFVAREDHSAPDLRKAADLFEPIQEVIECDRGELRRMEKAGAEGGLVFLGSVVAPNADAARAELAKLAKKSPPAKGPTATSPKGS